MPDQQKEEKQARLLSPEEAERLAEERAQQTRLRLEKQLSQERAARAAAEKELERQRQLQRKNELRRRAEEELDRRSLPRALAGTLRMEDEKTLSASLDAAEHAFRAAIERGVRERLQLPLSAPAPQADAPASRLTYRDAARLYASDRKAYEKRFGRETK